MASTPSASPASINLRPHLRWKLGLVGLGILSGIVAMLMLAFHGGGMVAAVPDPAVQTASAEERLESAVSERLEAVRPANESLELPQSLHFRGGLLLTDDDVVRALAPAAPAADDEAILAESGGAAGEASTSGPLASTAP